MSTNQITGTITTGVNLASGAYDNPVTVTNTGNVSGSAYGIYAATNWTIDNAGTIAVSSTPQELSAIMNKTLNGVAASVQEFGMQQDQ